MIDEMIWALDSPGNVAVVLILALLCRDLKICEGQIRGHKQRKMCRAGFCALGRSELVGCGVRLAAMAAASLNR